MSDQADEAVAPEAEKKTLKIGEGKPGPGRPKGVPNKSNAILKDAILLAAKRAGGDGDMGLVNYLETQATVNPNAFMSLLGKVLPMTVAGDGENPVFIAKIERVITK